MLFLDRWGSGCARATFFKYLGEKWKTGDMPKVFQIIYIKGRFLEARFDCSCLEPVGGGAGRRGEGWGGGGGTMPVVREVYMILI